jgi:hypothetical protein
MTGTPGQRNKCCFITKHFRVDTTYCFCNPDSLMHDRQQHLQASLALLLQPRQPLMMLSVLLHG